MGRKSEDNTVKYIALTLMFFILSCGCVTNTIPGSYPSIQRINESRINESINNGIDFLYLNQLEYGEFRTYACTERSDGFLSPGKKGCFFDSSPFATALILYSIRDVKNEKVTKITSRGIDFLLSEEDPGGLWNFWTSRNPKKAWGEPADIDDTSMVSVVLRMNNQTFGDNKEFVLLNKNQEGLFLTWFRPDDEKNDVDCVVNANVLFYLNKTDESVCSYINRAIKYKASCTRHYANDLALFYAVSRNLKHNISCFEESRETMVKSTLEHQKSDGSFGNELDTALALNTLLNCGYSGIEVNNGVDYLLSKQNNDGSWDRSACYVGSKYYADGYSWGSEELTTAFVIEAMQQYLSSDIASGRP